MKNTIDTLVELTNIPSPTGYTKKIMKTIFDKCANWGYQPTYTNKGSVIVTVKGHDDTKHRLVTAHLDTLGAMVKAIKEDGHLKLTLIGGFTFASIEGENCIIHSEDKEFTGTILMHQTSVHVYKDAATAPRDEDNIEVRIDEKVTNKKEVEALGISVGDFVSFDPRTIVTESGFIKSRHLDDKISAAILLDLLEQKIQVEHTTHFYFSNNEEIGYGGNSNIPSEVVEYLAVDMGAMGDDQTTDEYSVSICAKDSTGPYHYELRQKLVKLAQDNNIPYQIDIYPHYGSDASGALRAGFDIKHGLIGSGVESSHSYERSHKDSIEATQSLIEVYLKSNID